MQYWILQLFLTSRERPPLIDAISPARLSRRDYLEATFSGEINFIYRRKRHIFRSYQVIGNVIAAAIGREQTRKIKPKDDFQAQEVPDWETANVFIDISGDPSGLKVAFQKTPHISNPLEVFRALTDFINRRNIDTDWTISTNPVSQVDQFWNAVRENRGKLTELDLTYIPPNSWGGADETRKALKVIHAATNNDEVEVKLKNADGKLELETELVVQSVEYVMRGGGKAVLKSGKRKIFDTDSAVETESPEEDVEVEGASEAVLKKLIIRLFRRA